MTMRWFEGALACEGTPLLYADRAAYRRWHGSAPRDGASDYQRAVLDEGFTPPTEVVRFDGVSLGLLDSEGDRTFDIGVGDRELVVLAAYAVDDAKHEVRIRNAVAKKKYDEFLAGEIEVGSEGFVLADSAASAAALDGELPREAAKIGRAHFFVPLPAGRYVVLEGRDEEDDATPWWIRVQPAGKKKYPRRPEPQASDPVADVMARISFDDAVKEARSLEAALELIEHGRADLALSLCARASADRRYLAAFTRVLALAAAKDVAAKPEAAALANAWLAPADSATSANQMLTRAQVLRALDAAGADPALRARVAQAPEPDVFVAGGGDFF